MKRQRLIVPKDVRKKARKQVYERLVILIIGLVVAYVIVDYIYPGLSSDTNFGFGNLSTTIAVIFVIPFLISGIPFRVIDRDYFGEIIRIDITNNKTKWMGYHTVSYTRRMALIKTKEGKLYEKDIEYKGDIYSGDTQQIYSVGDKVIHVRRTDHLYPVREGKDDRPVVCVICGTTAQVGRKKCGCCGASLEISIAKERK